MKVLYEYEKRICDNCGDYEETFIIANNNGETVIRLCKKCLLELLKGIIER